MFPMNNGGETEEVAGAPVKYVPPGEVYDVTAPSDKASVLQTENIRERSDSDDRNLSSSYVRRHNRHLEKKPSFFENLRKRLEGEEEEGDEEESRRSKRRRVSSVKMVESMECSAAREVRINRKKKDEGDSKCKKWTGLSIDGDYKRFIGLECKVYWPLDDDWYHGHIVGYSPETDRHHVEYRDGDQEHLILSNERISFYISPEEMKQQKFSYGVQCPNTDRSDIDEMVAMAATLDDCDLDPIPGDMIWAKVTGHSTWPAIILDESAFVNLKGLNKISGEKSVLVQFFGTHDFSRLSKKQTIPFLRGLLSDFHLKCKKIDFVQSLVEAKTYLSNQKLPNRMILLQKSNTTNHESASANLGDEGTREEEIQKIMDELSLTSKLPWDFSKLTSKWCQHLPVGYRPIRLNWNDLDKCNVCHVVEEYENNPFLQCDNCRMMVHTRCYGEREPVDGILWNCNLCRVGAPEFPPPCSLCPIIGGAMKPTTDGRWAHLACAIWIPETCLIDVRKMEPIDGLNRINKDRWKLLCSICGVSHGACIQCSHSSCYVAFHPLCARAADFCLELEAEDKLHFIPGEEDEDNQCISLRSYCKKHRPPSNQRIVVNDCIGQRQSDYIPPPNPSGCARTEPYNYLGRRGTQEPQARGTVFLKRFYVENRPYLVGGYSQHESLSKVVFSQCDTSRNIFSMAEKYSHMKKTLRKRLTFGKSGIHGYGIFSKQSHIAGDMVIEYTGEVIRAPIADRREQFIYNSFVGAGTYIFQIDKDRFIDATKAGNIAHLINHSCEPNCYSRVITVNGDEHIIIFAKRDIKQWEELTYDYRFLSVDEQLACYCGFPRCRGVVNDINAEKRIIKLSVPHSDLTAETRISDCWLSGNQLENENV